MRAILRGQGSDVIRPLVERAGLKLVEGPEADVVLCYGGDGTLIGSDRLYPGIAKLAIRPDELYDKCPYHETETLLRRVAEGRGTTRYLPRIEAIHGKHHLLALNDIVLHNALVTSAVRYRVRIDGVPYSNTIVGDGLVVSTAFGSTAYYRSITSSVFRTGMGLAFNNSTESLHHLVLGMESAIEVQVVRGPAILVADNLATPLEVAEDRPIVIRKAPSVAAILEQETLTCMRCRNRETGRGAGLLHLGL